MSFASLGGGMKDMMVETRTRQKGRQHITSLAYDPQSGSC